MTAPDAAVQIVREALTTAYGTEPLPIAVQVTVAALANHYEFCPPGTLAEIQRLRNERDDAETESVEAEQRAERLNELARREQERGDRLLNDRENAYGEIERLRTAIERVRRLCRNAIASAEEVGQGHAVVVHPRHVLTALDVLDAVPTTDGVKS